MKQTGFYESTLGLSTARDMQIEGFYTKLFESHGQNLASELGSIFKTKETAQAFLESVNTALEDEQFEGTGMTNVILREDAAARSIGMQNIVNELLTEATQQGLAALQPITLTSFGFQIRSYVRAVMFRVVKTIQAEKPAFKITERKQFVIDINGTKHYFVNAFNRNDTLSSNLHKKFTFSTNVPSQAYSIFASNAIDDRNKLAIDLSVSAFTAVKADLTTPEISTDCKITSRRRDIDLETGRFSVEVTIGPEATVAVIMGEINFESATVSSISATSARIKTAVFNARLSAETHLNALVAGFEHTQTTVTIPDGAHIEVSPSTEFMDDTSRMLGVNVLEEYTSQMGKLVEYLEDSNIFDYLKSLEPQAILSPTFDVTPDAAFAYGREEWIKKEFHPFIERTCIRLKAELQLEDCHFRVVGNPMDIRVPNSAGESYIFRRNQDMSGTVSLNYDFAVVTTSNTIFYLSTDRVPPGKIYVLLIPNSIENNIITINHYRYANYVSNKYRSASNPALPAVMVSSRYKTKEYLPVMAVCTLNNNYAANYTGYYAQ
jgi:hypothetical protein